MKAFFESEIYIQFKPFLQVLVILIIGIILLKVLRKWANKLLEKAKVDQLIRTFIIHAVEIFIWIVIILSALNALGFDSTSVVTVLAASGAAVALALKDSLSNLAGGILLMFTKNFRSGDYIDACGVEGTVQNVDLLYTTILTGDNRTVVIPNGSLTTNTITNRSTQGKRRVDMSIGISYNADIDKAREVFVNLAKEDSRVYKDPAPFCAVEAYGDSAINLVFRVWCDASKYWDVKFDLQNKMKSALDAAKIEIPFPQIDVHMK